MVIHIVDCGVESGLKMCALCQQLILYLGADVIDLLCSHFLRMHFEFFFATRM